MKSADGDTRANTILPVLRLTSVSASGRRIKQKVNVSGIYKKTIPTTTQQITNYIYYVSPRRNMHKTSVYRNKTIIQK